MSLLPAFFLIHHSFPSCRLLSPTHTVFHVKWVSGRDQQDFKWPRPKPLRSHSFPGDAGFKKWRFPPGGKTTSPHPDHVEKKNSILPTPPQIRKTCRGPWPRSGVSRPSHQVPDRKSLVRPSGARPQRTKSARGSPMIQPAVTGTWQGRGPTTCTSSSVPQ